METSDAAEASLLSVLQALALPADGQIALYPEGRCVPCSLSLMWGWWSREFQAAWLSQDRSAEQRQALQQLEQVSEEAARSHRCHDNDAVRQGAEFAALRQVAAEALSVLGGTTGSPDLQYLPGTPQHAARCEQVERERKQRQRAARRPGKAKLRYHRALFEALQETPVVSRRQEELLREREQALGIRLPEAVFELLSLDGIAELFREHSNADELITNDEFDAWRKLEQLGIPAEVQQGYLRVAVENQGVVAFYVPLEGSADPPVFHNNDQWPEDLSQVDWVHCAQRFSEFVRMMMVPADDADPRSP